MRTTYEMLEKALALIEDEKNWSSRGWGSTLPGHERYCALHAARVAGWRTHDALRRQIPGTSIGDFNDSHSHKEVVELFQRAIRAEKEKAGVPIVTPAEQEVPVA